MKKTVLSIQTAYVFLGTLLICSASSAATLSDLELHGYLRAGVRSNSGDGANVCYHNAVPRNSGGNEFRLGNECEDYGELNFTAWQLKGKDAHDPYFKTNVTFNFATNANFHDETLNPMLFEAYVDAGNFLGSQTKYWAGKRVYRDASVHMNDEFYYANINGNGAGFYDIGMPTGALAVAYFLQQSNPAGGATTSVVKEHLLDVRWTNIGLADHQKLDFWGAYAMSRDVTAFTAGTTPAATASLNF